MTDERPPARAENGQNDPVGDKGYMYTYSDRVVDPLNLRPEDVDVVDIGWALSRQCRYNGHVAGFISVARHSVWVAELLWQEHKNLNLMYAGLHHDDAEAYLGDVIRPLKHRPELDIYREIEARAEAVIFEVLGVTYPLPPEVRAADTMAGHLERAYQRPTHRSTPERDYRDWRALHLTLTEGLLP